MSRNIIIDANHSSISLSYAINGNRVAPAMPATTPANVIDFLTRTSRVVSITATQWRTIIKRLYCSVLRTARVYEDTGEGDYSRFIARVHRAARKAGITPVKAFEQIFISLICIEGSITIDGYDSVVLIVSGTNIVLKGGADDD